ncbi:ABC transporter substrate-binding protein, partial [Xanthomonas citri pv. citri]|nr:ABC transporter substrate-binding protein [Xanthomonas citri pv. citri]
VVGKSTPEREKAAVTFLKWLTEPERNILFSISSGYMPVTRESNDIQVIRAAMEQAGTDQMVRDVMETGVQIATSYELYTNKPFEHGYEAR